MKRVLVAGILCACGGAAKTVSPAPAAKVTAATTASPTVITPELFCTRFTALKASGCSMFDKLDLDRDACLKQLGDPAMAQFRNTFGPCFVEKDCEHVAKCVEDAAAPKLNDLRACDNHDPDRAVGMPAAEWALRKGARVTRFVDAQSSKAQPFEVCGVGSENKWLVERTCEDGSHPYADNAEAEAARVGNVGAGGRCGSIIDLYKVNCPEALYEVYLDGYVCALPQ